MSLCSAFCCTRMVGTCRITKMNKRQVSHSEFIQHIFTWTRRKWRRVKLRDQLNLLTTTVLDISGLAGCIIEICGRREGEREARDFVYLAT